MLAALALLLAACAAGPALADDVPPEAVVAAIPFAPSDGGRRVRIDLAPPGKPSFVMMLDTGAAFSLLSPRAARQARVSVRRDKADPYRRATRLGRDVQFYVQTSSSDTGTRMGFDYSILGANFLSQYVVEIDFPGTTVRFLDPDRYAVPETAPGADETVVPFAGGGNRPVVEIQVDGRPVPVLLDTGGSVAVLLSGRAARSIGVDPSVLPEAGTVTLLLGPVAVRAHEAGSLRVGSLELGPRRVYVSPTGLYNAGGEAGDSVLGIEVLGELVTRIDYRRRRLLLRRSER